MPLNYPVLYKSMDARADAIVSAAVAVAIADAEKLWTPEKFDGIFPVKGFGIRKLVARDFEGAATSALHLGGSQSMAGWYFSITAASTWEAIISSGTLSDSAYVIITGIFNFDASPDIRKLKVTADGVEYPIYNLEEIYGWDVAIAKLSHPVIVRPEKKITIEVIADSAGKKHFGFLGYTVAKRSYLISKI